VFPGKLIANRNPLAFSFGNIKFSDSPPSDACLFDARQWIVYRGRQPCARSAGGNRRKLHQRPDWCKLCNIIGIWPWAVRNFGEMDVLQLQSSKITIPNQRCGNKPLPQGRKKCPFPITHIPWLADCLLNFRRVPIRASFVEFLYVSISGRLYCCSPLFCVCAWLRRVYDVSQNHVRRRHSPRGRGKCP
jgi:hypothetical protein